MEKPIKPTAPTQPTKPKAPKTITVEYKVFQIDNFDLKYEVRCEILHLFARPKYRIQFLQPARQDRVIKLKYSMS